MRRKVWLMTLAGLLAAASAFAVDDEVTRTEFDTLKRKCDVLQRRVLNNEVEDRVWGPVAKQKADALERRVMAYEERLRRLEARLGRVEAKFSAVKTPTTSGNKSPIPPWRPPLRKVQ